MNVYGRTEMKLHILLTVALEGLHCPAVLPQEMINVYQVMKFLQNFSLAGWLRDYIGIFEITYNKYKDHVISKSNENILLNSSNCLVSTTGKCKNHLPCW
jgi:hypothetical protein